MLPDFPKLKGKIVETINRYLQDLVRQEPLLSQFREERVFEGNKMSSNTENGQSNQSSYKKLSASYSIKREDVITKGPTVFIENIKNVAEEIKKQQAELVFNKLSEVTNETGNVVDAKGKPFTFELFMELLEKIEIDFDDQGKPSMPMLVVSPELGIKLKDLLPKWKANPEYTKRFQEVIEKKRKQWSDRESNRKLVD